MTFGSSAKVLQDAARRGPQCHVMLKLQRLVCPLHTRCLRLLHPVASPGPLVLPT